MEMISIPEKVKLKVIVNPTQEVIEEDMIKCDFPVIIHKKLEENELKQVIGGIIKKNLIPVYIHYYTGNKCYTIGVKNPKNKGKNNSVPDRIKFTNTKI